jgi:cardiolipin synthase A/B
MLETQLIGSLFAVLGLLLSTLASAHALLHKRRPQSAFGWIAVCYALPFVGPLLYGLFGINRVKTRAQKLRAGRPEPPSPTHVATAPQGLEALARLGFAVTGRPLTPGNSVDVLHDGEHTFPAMLAAIENARRRVFFSTYIFDAGPVGRQFVAALGAAAARGVDVRVLLDGVGELYSWPSVVPLLRAANVRVARFLPPRLWPPTISVNLRNHRKILAVDGAVAFTGGINVRDRYLAATSADRIVDLHFRLAGPIVAQMDAVFAHDWQFATGEGAAVEPSSQQGGGTALCRAISDGPETDFDRLTEVIVGAIGHAHERVAIMTPYFLPPRELIAPLQAAALEGVDVAVILPARNNLWYVHRATRHMLWELLQRGVRVYYQPAPFVHSKLFYVDDRYAQVGSANLDPRSLRLNFEMNVEVFDRGVVAELALHFEDVRRRSVEVTLADVDGRPLATKLVDGAAWLFSPYL